MTNLYLLLFIEIVLLLAAFMMSRQDILAPSVVMCGMFVISTVAAMLWGKDFDFPYGLDSVGVLSAGILTFVLAECVFRLWFQRDLTAAKKARLLEQTCLNGGGCASVQKGLLTALLVYDLLIMLWYTAFMTRYYGGIGGVVRTQTSNVTYIESDDFVLNPLQMILVRVVDISGYIAAFLLCQRLAEKQKDLWTTLRLLGIIALSQWQNVINAARGSILRMLTAMLVMYYILWHQKKGWDRNLSWKYMRIAVLCLAVGSPLFYYSLWWMGRTTGATLSEHVLSYLGQSIWLFDNFLHHPTKPVTWGEESLIGLQKILRRFLGMDIPIRNVNMDFTRLDQNHFGNVYTFFRRPYHDFGFWGMIVFTVLVAWLFSYIYYKKIKWRRRSARVDCWTLVYGYLFYWVVISSIDQGSQFYLSLTYMITIIGIVLGYRIMTRVRFVFSPRRSYRLE